jgi:hypothetical protein
MAIARSLVVLALFAAAAGTAYLITRGDDAAPVAQPTPSDRAVLPQAKPAVPLAAELPTPASAGIPEDDCIVYPDGTRLPPLNGVKKAPPIAFHRLTPFAKVVRKEFDRASGIDWYVHENGVRSTTRFDVGTGKAVGEVSMPAEPRPIVDDK